MRDSCGNSGTAETPQERRGGSAPAPRQRRHCECDRREAGTDVALVPVVQRRHCECDRREAETDVALVPLGESECLQRKSTLTFNRAYKK